jgi:hypothetical protein
MCLNYYDPEQQITFGKRKVNCRGMKTPYQGLFKRRIEITTEGWEETRRVKHI